MAREHSYVEIPCEEYKKYNITISPVEGRSYTRLFKHKTDDFLILYETNTFHDFEIYVRFIFPECWFVYCAACNSYSYNPNKEENLYVQFKNQADETIQTKREFFEHYRSKLQQYAEQAEDEINLNNIQIR